MRTKKIFSLGLIFALILGVLNFNSSYADQGTAITLSLNPATESKYEYYTNESTAVNLDFDLSGYDSSIQNADVVITVPKEYVESFVGSPLVSATGPTETETADGQLQLIYHFSNLTGGTSLQIPFRVQTKAGTTPGNYVLPINASLIASDGTTLVSSTQLDLKQIVREPNVIKVCNGKDEDGTISYGGQGTASDSNIIEPGTESEQVFWAMIDYPRLTDPEKADIAYLGVRKYEKIILTDTLPAGAVFEQTRNPLWTYDAATRTASFTIDSQQLATGIFSENLQIPSLNLIFPNGDTRLQYTNTMHAEFIPEDKQSYEGENVVAEDSIAFGLTTSLPTAIQTSKWTYDDTFYDQIASKTAEKEWYCHFSNPSKAMNLENIVVEDYKLDARMKYVSVMVWGGIKGTFTVESIDAEGNVTTISQNAKIEAGGETFDIPENAVSIRIKTNEGSYVPANSGVDLKVVTQLKDPENVHYNPNDSSDNMFSNSLKVSGTYVGTKTSASGSATASMRIMKYEPSAYLLKYCSKASIFVGEKADFTLVGDGGQRLVEPDTLQATKLIDFLPVGMEYVDGSAEMTGRYAGLLVSLEPTIIANYKGTGQTALIWEFANPLQQEIPYFYLYYSAIATKNMNDGISTNTAYWMWDNNGSKDSNVTQVAVNGNMTEDKYDFDDDGNLTETVAVATANVQFVPPKEVVASKYVKGSLDSTETLTGGRTEVGAGFSYKLALRNYSITDVRQLTALEVLPYVGDKTIVANETGNYTARNSEFDVQLTGPIVPPVGYTIYYTVDRPMSDSEDSPSNYAAGANWVTENLVSDWSTIQGIKIVMNSGVVLPTSETVYFTIPVKTPTDMSLTNGELAHNTFAVSTNGENDFLEANAASVMAVSYHVTGTAFIDKDKDGMLGTGETGLSGREVQLLNDDGTPALDLDGNPIKTTTKEDGSYVLNVFEKGNYYVHITTPEGYNITTQGAATDLKASHISETTGNTQVFTLTPENKEAVCNGGYYEKEVGTQAIEIKKIVKGNPSKDAAFTFELNPIEGPPTYPAWPKDNIKKQEITIEGSGTISFKAWNYTKPGVYTYKVHEVAGEDSHYAYDETVYTITDTVTLNNEGDLEVSRSIQSDSGKTIDGILDFTNKYTESKTGDVTKPDEPTKADNSDKGLAVQTGDTSHSYVLLTVALMSFIALMVIGLYWRRRTEQERE